MRVPKAQAVKDWIVSIDNLPREYRFSMVTGISAQRSVTTYNDGYSHESRKMVSNITYGDITLSKPYEPGYDKDLLDLFLDCQGGDFTGVTITATPVDSCNRDAVADPIVFIGCMPLSVEFDNIDRNSAGDVQMLNLTFAPQSMKS